MNDTEEYINNKLLLLPMSYKLRRYERFKKESINTEVVYLCMKNKDLICSTRWMSEYNTFSNNICLYTLNFNSYDEYNNYGRNMKEITVFNANVIIRHKKRMKFVKMIISKILFQKFPNMEIEHFKNDILPYLDWDTDSIFRGYNIEYRL